MELIYGGDDQCAYQINDSIYVLVREKEEYFLVIGDQKISKRFNTVEEALEDAKTVTPERVLQLIGAVIKMEKNPLFNVKQQ